MGYLQVQDFRRIVCRDKITGGLPLLRSRRRYCIVPVPAVVVAGVGNLGAVKVMYFAV